MINILEFSMLHEYKHAWNISARACFYIYENLENCMLLYRYKLAYNSLIFRKFGMVNPNKLDFDKLDGDNLFLFHLDAYKENTEDIRKLLDFCLEKEIDVYIPLKSKDSPIREGYDDKHIYIIRDILEEYNTIKYNIREINYSRQDDIDNAITLATKPLIRDIKMKKLFE